MNIAIIDIDKLKKHALKNKLHLLTTEKDYLRLDEKNKENIEHCKDSINY